MLLNHAHHDTARAMQLLGFAKNFWLHHPVATLPSLEVPAAVAAASWSEVKVTVDS